MCVCVGGGGGCLAKFEEIWKYVSLWNMYQLHNIQDVEVYRCPVPFSSQLFWHRQFYDIDVILGDDHTHLPFLHGHLTILITAGVREIILV